MKVRVMPQNRARKPHAFTPPKEVVTRSISPPERETTKEAEPISPTFIMEQIHDETAFSGEEKDDDHNTDLKSSTMKVRFTCSQSSVNPPTVADDQTDSRASTTSTETTQRWEELRRIVHEKIEDIQGAYSGHSMFRNIFTSIDLGESAMTAVAKNRDEIDKMIGKFDTRAIVGDQIYWFMETENSDDTNENSIFRCSDVRVCLQPQGDSFKHSMSNIVSAS